MINVVKGLRDEAVQEGGDSISPATAFFLGAAWTPLGPPEKFRILRLAKKIDAGADFIQTQAIFDVDRFAKWMEMVTDRGLDKEVHILAGIIPIKSVGMGRYMRDNVPGVSVPDEIVARMEDAKEAREEGLKICLEIIEQIKDVPGVHGIHIMAVGWEDIVPVIVERAGLLPRPLI